MQGNPDEQGKGSLMAWLRRVAPGTPRLDAGRLRMLAQCWIAVAVIAYGVDLMRQTRAGLTDGGGRPLGDDFINYWSGAVLAWRHAALDVYSWEAFHAFEQSVAGAALNYYHYSYPPPALLLTAPLAALPYIPGLAAWLIGSWYVFYRVVAAAWPQAGRRDAALLAAATPAVFLNVVGGQNGAWSAALLGGGLVLLDRRPKLAGVLFGLMIYKPHLALLVPVALLAGRRWQAFAAAALTVVGLVALSTAMFGIEIWKDYAAHVTVLRKLILEDGEGVWHRMVSVFVMARHFGAGVTLSYALQACSGAVAAAVVAWAWRRDIPAAHRNALFVLGTLMAAPYLQDYDLVIGALVAVWTMQMAATGALSRRAALAVSALVLLVPAMAAPLAKASGLALGAIGFGTAFVIVAAACRPAPRTASAGR
jgi:hypothetical protein